MGGTGEVIGRQRAYLGRPIRAKSVVVRSRSADHTAFTLIELLVVIAIIALLMAISFPVLSHVGEQARGMICRAHLRQWGMALATYTQENRDRFPATSNGYDGVWLLRGAFRGDKDANDSQDSYYHFHTQDIVCCPMAKQFSDNRVFGVFAYSSATLFPSFRVYGVAGFAGSAFTAWEIGTEAPPFRGSYGLNQWLFKGFGQSNLPKPKPGWGIDLDVLSLQRRADIPALLDAVSPFSAPDGAGGPKGSDGSPSSMANFATNRHGESTNALFLDWSVRKIGLKELWKLKWSSDFNTNGPWTKAGHVRTEAWPPWMRGFKGY